MDNYKKHEVKWTKEKIGRFWNYYVAQEGLNEQFFTKQVGKEIIKLTNKYIKANGSNLDYGCGGGDLMGCLFDQGIQCGGLDSSSDSLKKTNDKYGDNKYFQGVILSFDLPHKDIKDNTYDFIFFIETIEHLLPEELPKVLSEIYRVLKPGGYIFITTPHNEKLDKQKIICPDCGCIFHRVQHLRKFSRESLRELMKQNNFKTIFCKATLIQKNQSIVNRLKYFFNYCDAKITGKKLFRPHLIYLGKK